MAETTTRKEDPCSANHDQSAGYLPNLSAITGASAELLLDAEAGFFDVAGEPLELFGESFKFPAGKFGGFLDFEGFAGGAACGGTDGFGGFGEASFFGHEKNLRSEMELPWAADQFPTKRSRNEEEREGQGEAKKGI